MTTGPSRLNTVVQEHHDITTIKLDELSTEIFNAPNVQVGCRDYRAVGV